MEQKRNPVDRIVQFKSLDNIPELADLLGVLGDEGRIHVCGDLYLRHADIFELIRVHALMEEQDSVEDHTPAEMRMFKKGLLALPTFLLECYNRSEMIRKEKTP